MSKTKRGKGTKVMAMADRADLPLAVHIAPTSQRQVTLVEAILAACVVDGQPERLIGDKAYDSDPLDEALAVQGIGMIAPHRAKRRIPKTLDGPPSDGTNAAGK